LLHVLNHDLSAFEAEHSSLSSVESHGDHFARRFGPDRLCQVAEPCCGMRGSCVCTARRRGSRGTASMPAASMTAAFTLTSALGTFATAETWTRLQT